MNAAIKLTNVRCTTMDQTFGDFKECSLKAVKRHIVEINIHFNVKVDVIDNATLAMRFNKRGNSGYSLYQYKVDVCEFLRNKRRNPLAEIFYSLFQFAKYSNINHTCPYYNDIIVKGCQLNTQLLNYLAVPSGEYTVLTHWFLKNKSAAKVDVSIMID